MQKRAFDSDVGPLVSIIIPTFNSANTFSRCAQSIVEQTYKHIETIVIDNQSSDGTREIALASGFRLLVLASNRAIARERGIQVSDGEFVFLVDSDQTVDSRCVEVLVRHAIEKGADGAVVFESTEQCDRWTKLLACEDLVEFELGLGIPRWFRREVALATTKFSDLKSPHVYGEDRIILERSRALGFKFSICRDAKLVHSEGDVIHFLRKQFQNSVTDSSQILIRDHRGVAIRIAARKANPASAARILGINRKLIGYLSLVCLRFTFQAAGFILSRSLPESRAV